MSMSHIRSSVSQHVNYYYYSSFDENVKNDLFFPFFSLYNNNEEKKNIKLTFEKCEVYLLDGSPSFLHYSQIQRRMIMWIAIALSSKSRTWANSKFQCQLPSF